MKWASAAVGMDGAVRGVLSEARPLFSHTLVAFDEVPLVTLSPIALMTSFLGEGKGLIGNQTRKAMAILNF